MSKQSVILKLPSFNCFSIQNKLVSYYHFGFPNIKSKSHYFSVLEYSYPELFIQVMQCIFLHNMDNLELNLSVSLLSSCVMHVRKNISFCNEMVTQKVDLWIFFSWKKRTQISTFLFKCSVQNIVINIKYYA